MAKKQQDGPALSGMKIADRPVGDLRPYQANPRTHSEDQIAQLMRSIQKFGWTNPILIDESGMIVAGHARHEAAVRLGLKTAPCILLSNLSPEDVRAYVIADNQLALQAGWDMEVLRQEVEALQGLGYELELLGFDQEDLTRILAPPGSEGECDPEEAPDPEPNPISRAGDVWLLGGHRVVCGDSTSPDVVSTLLGGVVPALMVTDPPYGVNYDPAWREKSGLGGEGTAKGKVKNDDRADWGEAYALFPGSVAYVWHAGTRAGEFQRSLEAVGFKVRAQIVWVKNRFAISRGAYHHQHEPCFVASKDGEDDHWQQDHGNGAYAVRDGERAGWQGSRKESTVWFIDHRKNDTGHGTQKPIDCMKRPILNNSSPGMAVYDPFLGSGTTLIAAQITGRVCYGCEPDLAVENFEARSRAVESHLRSSTAPEMVECVERARRRISPTQQDVDFARAWVLQNGKGEKSKNGLIDTLESNLASAMRATVESGACHESVRTAYAANLLAIGDFVEGVFS